MTVSSQLLWAAACSDVARATELAKQLRGSTYADHRDDPSHLPFAALTTGVSDDMELLREFADVGLYVVCERTIKPGNAAIFGLFPMVGNPSLSHTQADAHWRDTHAPLALQHHAFMTHYLQLSVVHTVSGTPYDGFALCGFDNLEDLRERFFSEPDSRQVISDDIAKFADTANSPRRLLAVPEYFQA